MGLLLDFITSGLAPYIAGALAIIAALFAARRGGQSAEKRKAENRNLKNRLKRGEIEHEVDQMDADTRDKQLTEWMRDNPK